MPPVEALRELAGRVALQLVAEALQHLVGSAPATLTLEPAQPSARLALPPKPARRGKKPGPKKKLGRPRKLTPRQAPESSSLPVEALARRCRKCKRVGPCGRVRGTARTVKCGFCGFTWDARATPAEGKAEPAPASCVRCDHDATQHEGSFGKCLVPRCVCTEFYA